MRKCGCKAQAERAAVLTSNIADFVALSQANPDHFGLLLVYRVNDPTRDLRAVDIVERVVAVAHAYPDGLEGLTLAVNNFPSE